MARLIDVDEFAKTLEKTDANVCADYGDGFCEFGYSRSLLRLLLSEATTVDAVEVVRCKDCAWGNQEEDLRYCENPNAPWIDDTDFSEITVTENDFCSYGERRTD